MLPGATRLLRLPASTVREIAPSLRGERLLAVGVDHPATVANGNEEPVCVCRVVAVRRLPAGAIRILLRGESRGVRLSTSHQHERIDQGRAERVDILPDECHDPPTIDREHRCEELRMLMEQCVPGSLKSPNINSLLEQASLGRLCDMVADCIGIVGEEGLQLLSATNVELRSDILLDALRSKVRRASTAASSLLFPSAN